MFTPTTSAALDVTRMAVFGMLLCLFLCSPAPGDACSCQWRGPFLTVAKDAPLVVRGRILGHHQGKPPTMDVLVTEPLSGGLLDSGLVIQMGDGMHCRPTVDQFPPATEWILALNGPGSKPGKGHALSHCGEYWLRVENGDVVGSIDGAEGQVKRMSYYEFLMRFRYPRFQARFVGEVASGQPFRRPFGSRFEFILEPMPSGWEIVIREYGSEENLARLTPPLHFAPNPREIEGWSLADDPSRCSSRPYAAEAGPENPRRFIFSPEVGVRIDSHTAGRAPTPEDIESVQNFGHGVLTIEDFRLQPQDDECPKIAWMKFSVQVRGGY